MFYYLWLRRFYNNGRRVPRLLYQSVSFGSGSWSRSEMYFQTLGTGLIDGVCMTVLLITIEIMSRKEGGG